MAFDIETPSEVMFGSLKKFGGIKNNELARILFTQTFTYGGVPIISRLDDRPFVSRTIARAAPGDFPEMAFRPFPESTQAVYSKLASRYPRLEGKQTIISYFTGEACDEMSECLRELGLNDILYRNIVGRVSQMEHVGISDKAVLTMLPFIATGALGDPSRASKITQEYIRRISADNLETEVVKTGVVLKGNDVEAKSSLGLCRLIDGKMRMPAYPLSTDEEGTEIGSLASSAGAINDVGPGVSRRHVRIFRASDGFWYAQGMGSTNGTIVVHANDGSEETVELPRSHRAPGEEPPAIRIYAHDTLRLASSTYFAVLEIV
ncbi:MAG: FHA domain-containing protein [Eggerthellaceae bacterium]|nr:FHA domain-containing protein [Eggerthellaceae bacterium]